MAEGSWIAWKLYHPKFLSTLTFTVREWSATASRQCTVVNGNDGAPIRIVVSTDLTRTTRAARTRTHPVRHEADSRRADARHATDVHLRSVRPTARPAKVRHIFDRGARAPQGHASGPSQATAGRGRDTVRVTSDQMAWVFFTSATGCF